ncbi:protein RRNAD1 isoform X2 [Folsomia candida]|uniref:protein RRNAD1 isoform X2 n=1 Tax=Folsomia candida TaxID=158441 RepID=UPI000B8F685B|nr:protein RRNAD1 isoform X2 [Folsomia candida]
MVIIQEQETRHWMSLIYKFLSKFAWLADSFVLDFYEKSHWNMLPLSCQDFLPTLKSHDLADLLDFNSISNKHGWEASLKRKQIPPLNLLALRSTVKLLSLNRRLVIDGQNDEKSDDYVDEFKTLFSRHVKPKKRHEIISFCSVVSKMCNSSSTSHIFDVGSGLGHLSRYLSYGCSLNLTCIDCVNKFGESATKFDSELESFLTKRKAGSHSRPPIHICARLELNKHEKELQLQDENFGIVGLHSCGNLGPVIIHNYVNSPAKFALSVGCCWQKMDGNGFPLSKYGTEKEFRLSYEALEVACHAIEQYCERLRGDHVGKLMKFGIQRAGLKGVKHAERISFCEYAHQAVKNLDINLSDDSLKTEEIDKMLKDWFKVVLFFSLRQLVANVVETLVILDRSLFIKENLPDAHVQIVALFDPEISPRNLAIISER